MARNLTNVVLSAGFAAVVNNLLADGITVSTVPLNGKVSQAFQNGSSGAGKADSAWGDAVRTLAGSATDTIDLNAMASIDIGAGSGKDPLGVAIANAKVMGLLIISDPASVGTLTVGDAGSNAWAALLGATGTMQVGPGQWVMIGTQGDGWATDSTHKNLLITNSSAGSTSYGIFLLGRSA